MAVIAAIITIAAVFATVQVFSAGRVVEPFSELGLLGPDGKIANYPQEVVAGSPFLLNVYVGNHEGRTAYYKVLVKVGDGSSVINQTSPLLTEPIMEIRTVMVHNSSRIFPVNITLYKPATNVRLIFELWIFNETAGTFYYHGRWNQLWINVTKPLIGEVSAHPAVMSPEVEAKLVSAIFAVRRAEDSGGNVTEMVRLINDAIKYAESGNEAEALHLLTNVLSMETEVARAGLEARRNQLYLTIGSLSSISALGVGLFLYLRRKVWIFWARLYKSWKVVWIGSTHNLNEFEKRVKELVKSGNGLPLNSLISSLTTIYREHEVAREIFRLVRRKAVEIFDPNPPKSFFRYVLSRHNSGFAAATLLIALCIVFVYASDLYSALTVPRIALGSLFVLFLPGYSLIEALYPRGDELSPLERLALSIGLSLALVPLVGLILNYTPWGIRLDPIIASLSGVTLALLIASSYRKFGLLILRTRVTGG